MTKKRFVKLMMARGFSRNTATALATQVSRYGSYAAMYQKFEIISTPTLARISPDMIRRIYVGLAALFDAMAEAFSGFAESMRRAADG